MRPRDTAEREIPANQFQLGCAKGSIEAVDDECAVASKCRHAITLLGDSLAFGHADSVPQERTAWLFPWESNGTTTDCWVMYQFEFLTP